MADPVRYAGFWIRVLAALIDSVLVTIVIAPPLYWIYGKGYFEQLFDVKPLLTGLDPGGLQVSVQVVQGPADILLTWVLPAIGIVLFWLARQATPGKMLLSLRIVDANTLGPLGTGQAIVRYLGYYVSIIPCLLGLLWVAFDRRKQGWHDKLAGTVVIRVHE